MRDTVIVVLSRRTACALIVLSVGLATLTYALLLHVESVLDTHTAHTDAIARLDAALDALQRRRW